MPSGPTLPLAKQPRLRMWPGQTGSIAGSRNRRRRWRQHTPISGRHWMKDRGHITRLIDGPELPRCALCHHSWGDRAGMSAPVQVHYGIYPPPKIAGTLAAPGYSVNNRRSHP